MADGFQDIIVRLEQQKDAIERALTALRDVEGSVGETTATTKTAPSGRAPRAPRKAKAKRKGGMTPEGRARLIAALKRRWAKQKAGQATAAKSSAKKAAPKKARAKRARAKKVVPPPAPEA